MVIGLSEIEEVGLCECRCETLFRALSTATGRWDAE
jgi:hypothetical protein